MIGEFLRTRRRQLVRADFGLPPIARGSSGLRREEVAYLARVSITWYTRLEQGRAITPSRQVLDALAQTLRLSTAEHTYLLSLAGYSAPQPADDPIPQTDYYRLLSFFHNIAPFHNGGPGDEAPILTSANERRAYEQRLEERKARRTSVEREAAEIRETFRQLVMGNEGVVKPWFPAFGQTDMNFTEARAHQ